MYVGGKMKFAKISSFFLLRSVCGGSLDLTSEFLHNKLDLKLNILFKSLLMRPTPFLHQFYYLKRLINLHVIKIILFIKKNVRWVVEWLSMEKLLWNYVLMSCYWWMRQCENVYTVKLLDCFLKNWCSFLLIFIYDFLYEILSIELVLICMWFSY